ncbi:Inositol oxygenase 1 [Ancistrocladus abbreviatus]
MKEEYGKLNRAEMSIWECVELLNSFVDESDPDLDEPQIEHLLQSAEAIRRDYPNEDWLHLTALIHDLGKVLLHDKFGALPQWSVVGDPYPLGCAFSDKIVHHKYFKENPDFQHPVYSTKLGVYTENCGLDKVTMTWGHDEYMYLVAKYNKTSLPTPGLFIIRFHSYALHREGEYNYLMNKDDEENLKWLKIFNKYDLYSKSKIRVDVDQVKPYYMSLVEKQILDPPAGPAKSGLNSNDTMVKNMTYLDMENSNSDGPLINSTDLKRKKKGAEGRGHSMKNKTNKTSIPAYDDL